MKQYMKLILAIFLSLALLTSCKKGFLDKVYDEDLTIDSVFANAQYAERFLSSAYFSLPEESEWIEWWGRNPFTTASDDLECTWGVFGNQMNTGNWNAATVEQNIYRVYWEGIRKVNIFIENIDKTDFSEREPSATGRTGEQQKQEFKGEAHFLRAFYHFIEMRVHGPVSILDKALSTADDYTKIKRSPYDECVAFVVQECDRAAALLPVRRTNVELGRATKMAALALKARILLYAASPLYNGNSDYANFKDDQGRNLISPTYDANKWQRAADAAKDCMTQAEAAGYMIYKPTNDPYQNYYRLFIDRWNDEVLFARNMGTFNRLEYASGAKGMGGWSGYCPTQELVDAFQMANGTTPITGYNTDGTPIINAASGYQETGYAAAAGTNYPAGVRNMYVNREPRFYVSINFNGQRWRGRQLELHNSGRDGRAVGNGQDYPVTGYLLRKFADEQINLTQAGTFTFKTWIYFRMAEVYLNYAEALNEAQGPTADVYTNVNKVRERAGLPALPAGLSQTQMRERIRHERRIELAFETQRYFDCNRWKIAPETSNKTFYRLSYDKGTSIQDDAFYQRVVLKRRIFEAPKHYLWPIPQTEIDRALWIVQNPGW
ncbi:RagB/SusD family nutrient uptake outer membrane protein [Niabella sp. 22666]|uniref:RagB/SusD family nutrient uptake outer membrane protein n=1 Tax=Niabella sp. 22666 TaxID=3453954 RepID=UPI003F84D895